MMPIKPTEPFGHIAFGKDGSVRKCIDTLPPLKSDQELRVGQFFAERLPLALPGRCFELTACDENDHDFRLTEKGGEIIVQATEIVSRDYRVALAMGDYRNGNHSFSRSVFNGANSVFGVDESAKERVLLNRIKMKISKNYSKPKAPLWLLVWTVSPDFYPFASEAGMEKVSDGVVQARKYLAENSAYPFDQIWFQHLNLRPNWVWPE